MKNLFLAIIACSALFFMACSDDDSFNTGDAIVSMKNPVGSVKENKGIYTVPIAVTGVQNGPIEVTVAVSVVDNSCVEDEHFLVTSKTVTIPASKTEGRIEIKTVDDHVINDNRTFDVTITDVKGARLDESLATTRVTIMDNDDLPYDRMGGKWTVTANNLQSEVQEEVTWTVNLQVYDDDDPQYGLSYTVSPWMDWSGNVQDMLSFPLYFSYNEVTNKATVKIQLGSVMAEGVNFNSDGSNPDLEECSIVIAAPSSSSFSTKGEIVGTVSEDFKTITFNYPMMGIIYTSKGQAHGYFFSFSNIKFTFNE